MSNKNNNVTEVQGTEETTKRKTAPLHAIKSYNGSVDRVIDAGVVNQEDGETLKKIGKKMVEQYLGLDLFK